MTMSPWSIYPEQLLYLSEAMSTIFLQQITGGCLLFVQI